MSSSTALSRACALALCITAMSSSVLAGPCNIYASGGTPCTAAHSTTRALYDAYNGPLYQVKRGSDGAVRDIPPLSAGQAANSAIQDDWCKGTTCLISIIYDQSEKANHLTQAPKGFFSGPDVGGSDNLASAIGAPATLNGQKVYGVFVSPGTGYRNNAARGLATGDGTEGVYAVFDGTHFNGACCFDYGNAETSGLDTGNGHMQSLYLGDNTDYGSGSGSGPWVMADLENGLFSGANPKNNPANPSISYRFVTAILKGRPNQWALRGGDAATGPLSTYYSGRRPDAPGYNPMSLEGALILGIGGDNSNGGQGTFYEGVMTAGYPSDATENAVQANIVSAKYATTNLNIGNSLTVGSSISLRATSACCSTRYLAHSGATVNTQVVSSTSSTDLKRQASFTVRAGLGNSNCFSFESKDTPGSFIRHSNYQLKLNAGDGSRQFNQDATFCTQTGLNGQGLSIRSWNYPTRYLRHFQSQGYIASNGGVNNFDAANFFNDDVSWVISAGFA